MTLDDYRTKRDIAVTPETRGLAVEPASELPESRFVVQEHHARHLHYDFRLEMDGVLRSWAVPKGPPEEPGLRRLAVAVEDHAISYIDFEGTISAGQYGAGTVHIWDSGTYVLEMGSPDELRFVLHGKRLQGPYALIHFKHQARNWLLMKLDRTTQ